MVGSPVRIPSPSLGGLKLLFMRSEPQKKVSLSWLHVNTQLLENKSLRNIVCDSGWVLRPRNLQER